MKAQRGFSLIEVVVAIGLLALFLLGIAKANFVLARRFYALSAGASRDAEIAQQVNQFASMPFDSLKGKVGTKTFSTMPMPFTRTIVVDSLSPRMKRVTIIIAPTIAIFKADTSVIQRSKPGQNPFNH